MDPTGWYNEDDESLVFIKQNFDKAGQINTEKMTIQVLGLRRSEWCELDARVKTSSLSGHSFFFCQVPEDKI